MNAELIRILPLSLVIDSVRGYFSVIQITLISSGLLDCHDTLNMCSMCTYVIVLFCWVSTIIIYMTLSKIFVHIPHIITIETEP